MSNAKKRAKTNLRRKNALPTLLRTKKYLERAKVTFRYRQEIGKDLIKNMFTS